MSFSGLKENKIKCGFHHGAPLAQLKTIFCPVCHVNLLLSASNKTLNERYEAKNLVNSTHNINPVLCKCSLVFQRADQSLLFPQVLSGFVCSMHQMVSNFAFSCRFGAQQHGDHPSVHLIMDVTLYNSWVTSNG